MARAGEEVTLIARGKSAAYLQEHGATITGLADFTVPGNVITNPQQVREADLLLVTVQTYDMASALASVKPLAVGSVLSIQNDVLKNEQLAQTFGWDKVLGAMAAFFPTMTLSRLSQADTTTALRRIGEQFASRAPTHKVSTLQDLEQGKCLEVEETLGYAVRKGGELGVLTPAMDTC